MLKQWSLESVHYSHGYQNIEKSDPDVHVNFSNWLDINYVDKKIKIVDIGGGNGRVCLSINKNIEEYWCLDLNEANIKAGQNFFKDDERIKFINFDVDNQELDIECDVVYIDSVLTMIEDPFGALIKFSKVSDFTFVNRTEMKEEKNKTKNKWGGMTLPSTLWSFSYNSILEFCKENNLHLYVIDQKTFLIKNNTNKK
jgi:SAM-dependent methyltransferase